MPPGPPNPIRLAQRHVHAWSGVTRDVTLRVAVYVTLCFALLVAFAVLGAGCSSSSTQEAIDKVDLAHIAANQEDLAGHDVETTGTVRSFDEGGPDGVYFVLEDDAHNRVELVPKERFVDLVGSKITVIGRFDFDDAHGRVLRVESVHPVT